MAAGLLKVYPEPQGGEWARQASSADAQAAGHLLQDAVQEWQDAQREAPASLAQALGTRLLFVEQPLAWQLRQTRPVLRTAKSA